MEARVFSIRKSFLLPLGLIVLLTLALLTSCIYLRMPLAKILILAVFLLPALLFFIESCVRRVRIDDTSLCIHKLFRRKRFHFQDLTAIDTVLVRRRAFVSLSTEEDFIILSNSYAQFGALIELLLQKVPEAIISEETLQWRGKLPEKSNDIFSAWLAVLVLLLILLMQMKSAF